MRLNNISSSRSSDFKKILDEVGNPREGLPEEVFEFVTSVTPMVNVDLLVRDEQDRILLARRDDKFDGPVWHIPGGIVRFQETLLHRVEQVAMGEIGQNVITNGIPLAVNEIMSEHQERGHFISFLYECRLKGELTTAEKTQWKHGDLRWFGECPANLIECQKKVYKKYFKK